MVCDELRNGVEEVLFCQVILVLGCGAYHVMADCSLQVPAESICTVSGSRRGLESVTASE